MEKLIKNRNSTVLCNTLISTDCINCIENNTDKGYAHIDCPVDGISKRIGFIKVVAGSVYGCDGSRTTTKNFKNMLNEISSAIPELNRTRTDIQIEIEKQATRRIERLVHNLRNNNAHLLQTIQLFIPEEMSRMKVRKLYEIVKSQMCSKRHEAIMTFLRILKHSAEYKAELAVYDLLNGGHANLDIKLYKAYDLIKVVFHEFYADFRERNVYVDIGQSYDEIFIDYDSFKVALYYLFENAVKYVLPDSTITFIYMPSQDSFTIRMNMKSVLVSKDELTKIFDEGYSGEMAKLLHREGGGIGLYRTRKLIELNKGEIIFDAGEQVVRDVDGVKYANNTIIIKLYNSDK